MKPYDFCFYSMGSVKRQKFIKMDLENHLDLIFVSYYKFIEVRPNELFKYQNGQWMSTR